MLETLINESQDITYFKKRSVGTQEEHDKEACIEDIKSRSTQALNTREIW
jgi:hypothetical protein